MIATLRGEISQIEDNALIIEVGGVGMRVFAPAPLRTKLKVGEVAFLFTHLVVREDALTLYGFESQADRDLFNMLLGVDGVGPKVALSFLSTMTLDSIRNAVFSRGALLHRNAVQVALRRAAIEGVDLTRWTRHRHRIDPSCSREFGNLLLGTKSFRR